jgi:4-nitrophenyl phosphatase
MKSVFTEKWTMDRKLQGIQSLILDMDGVLWRDQQPIGDLPAIFSRIDHLGLKVTLATNNATLSSEKFLEKLAGFRVQLESWQIINSAQAAANYLWSLFPQGGPLYIIGEAGLQSELASAGFHPGESPLAVIVGLDRQFTYAKLEMATRLVRSGLPFIATNPDRTLPTPDGLIPGAGAIVAAIEAASDVHPTIIGKPSPELYRLAMQRMSAVPDSTLVVGDRLETDIAGAQQIGCRAALVLSGVSTREQGESWVPKPDLITENMTDLLNFLD